VSGETAAIIIAIISLLGVMLTGLYQYRSHLTSATEQVGKGFMDLLSAYRHELNTIQTRLAGVEKELASTREELAEARRRIVVLEAENTVLKAQLLAAGIPPLAKRD
jgi:septal ring factor EnvC (AmiA/AmiB activator)